MCKRSHNVLILHMCTGWSSQVSMGNLTLSFRRWDYSTILCITVSPIHKYMSEPSLDFITSLFEIKHLLKKMKYFYLPAYHAIINQHQ